MNNQRYTHQANTGTNLCASGPVRHRPSDPQPSRGLVGNTMVRAEDLLASRSTSPSQEGSSRARRSVTDRIATDTQRWTGCTVFLMVAHDHPARAMTPDPGTSPRHRARSSASTAT
jgi:hypothetical protein